MMTPFEALACPLDGKALHCDGKSWRCDAGHSFDIASQGYTHLLPVQKKRSRDPGDSKEMVAARRRFLNAGNYHAVAMAIANAALAGLPHDAPGSLLDAGCGEGYYLRQLAGQLSPRQRLAVVGLDISKWAVLAAARQCAQVRWVVGSNANLPMPDASVDRVLCVFGFPVYSEFSRVLKPGGVLVQADAGPDHLRELREVIYPTLKPPRNAETSAPSGFVLQGVDTTHYPLTITGNEQITDLLAMTPHLHRASAEGRSAAQALTSLSVTVDVRVTRWQRDSSQAA
ncbi:putative RNA methyltransferase [Allopusillimonas ginsengisoli]|uniref:putative RNA methyltransferase n=1 Tax=Allopusillimonas ginsengisoli TaxID=453575 RepID=UPI0039C187FA